MPIECDDNRFEENPNFNKFEFEFCDEAITPSTPTSGTLVSVLTISPIYNGMKVILTDGREFSFPFLTPINGTNGLKGDKGDEGEAITILSSSTQDIAGVIRLTINFSDLTSINIDIPKGAKGDAGTNGTNGTNANFFYSSNVDPNPVIGNNSDLYLNYTSGDLYKRITGTWTLVSNLKGTSGDDGQNGSKIYRGSGIPVSAVLENDYYIDTDVMDLYVYISSSWVLEGTLKGDKGDTGDTGLKGDKGDKGDTGNNGRSTQVFISATEPTGGTYYNGDIWIVE